MQSYNIVVDFGYFSDKQLLLEVSRKISKSSYVIFVLLLVPLSTCVQLI